MAKLEEESWLTKVNSVDGLYEVEPIEIEHNIKYFVITNLLDTLGITYEKDDYSNGFKEGQTIKISPNSTVNLPTLQINAYGYGTGQLQYALFSSDPSMGFKKNTGDQGIDLRMVKIVLDTYRGEKGENFDLYFSEKDRLLRIGLPQSRHQQQAIPLEIGGDNYHIVGLQFIPDLSPRTIINGTVGFLTT